MSSAEAPSPDESGTPRTRPELSVTQIVASTLAAVTATIAASYFGVSGTVIGAALASVVTVVGNALYSHSIRRTRERVLNVVPIRPDAFRRPPLEWRPRRALWPLRLIRSWRAVRSRGERPLWPRPACS